MARKSSTSASSLPGASESDLLRTKVHRPRTLETLVERPSLVDRLEAHAKRRVTLISAPAGYGKSMLTAQWLERPTAPRSAWLSLDRRDSELERFVRYAVAALRTVVPDCLEGAEELLSATNLPAPEYFAEFVVADLERLDQRTILVLDDYNSIRDLAVHEFVGVLVTYMPASLHLVLLTRIDPPLPLSLWRSRKWLGELRGADLRFSREETRAVFEAAADLELSNESIDTIHFKTEGWITGIHLAILSIVGSTTPTEQVRAFSGTDRLVVDYLMEEALAVQPTEILEFLALTAPLERFCPPLCDRLLANHPAKIESRAILDRLYRENVFLVPLDERGEWYRHHHLFRELLLDHFDQLGSPSSQQEICRQAGAWFANEGWLEEGLHYLVEAGQLDAAADIVARHLHTVLNNDLSRRTLRRWLEVFPAGAETGRLPLTVASLYIKVSTFEAEAIQAKIQEVGSWARESGSELQRTWREVLESDLESLRAYSEFFSGNPGAAYEHASRAIRSTLDPRGYQYSLAILYVGAGLALSGRGEAALRFVDEGIAGARRSGSPQIGPYLVIKTAIHHYWGELEACQEAGLECLAVAEALAYPRYFQVHVHLFLGNVAYEMDLIEQAEVHFRAIEMLRLDANRMLFQEALIGLGQVALARDDRADAKRFASEARAYATEAGGLLLFRNAEGFDRRVEVATGRIRVSPGPSPVTEDFMYLSLYTPSYSWAWRQLHEASPGDRATALEFIDKSLAAAEAHGVERRVVQLQILRAVALHTLARPEEAVLELERTLDRGQPLGFVRSFVDGGPRVQEMLQQVVKRRPDDAYPERLLQAFGGPALDTRDNVEDLTNREMDVLELLQQRLTNKEIAARLGISPTTVKMHTLSLYGKLGVHGRRQAVAKAIERGILTA